MSLVSLSKPAENIRKSMFFYMHPVGIEREQGHVMDDSPLFMLLVVYMLLSLFYSTDF